MYIFTHNFKHFIIKNKKHLIGFLEELVYRDSVMKYGSSNNSATVDVFLKRRLTGIFMTEYMPTILLNIIGHSTKYFKSLYFDAKITVNLTVS